MTRMVRVVTAGDDRTAQESVEFSAKEIIIRRTPEGVSILPGNGITNRLGFVSLFYPWSEVRQIKEFDKDDG